MNTGDLCRFVCGRAGRFAKNGFGVYFGDDDAPNEFSIDAVATGDHTIFLLEVVSRCHPLPTVDDAFGVMLGMQMHERGTQHFSFSSGYERLNRAIDAGYYWALSRATAKSEIVRALDSKP